MSRNAEIELWFGDEERTFRLGLKQLRRLQEKCADRILGERGPFTILRDLQSGTWKVDDVYQTILLGLIGAGMKEEDAAKLVKERLEDRVGLHNHTLTASAIIMAAMTGPAEDRIDPGKGSEQSGETQVAMTGSASPTSTDREPSSGGPPDRSTN
jgi:hypothetical protein